MYITYVRKNFKIFDSKKKEDFQGLTTEKLGDGLNNGKSGPYNGFFTVRGSYNEKGK